MSAQTYHCQCTTRILVTTMDLTKLPRRQEPGLDEAIIYPLSYNDPIEELSNLVSGEPVLVRRDDGFEKRIQHRCARCRVVIAYELADKPGRAPIIYILPGWLITLEAMKKGRQIDDRSVVLGQGPSPAAFT